MPERPIKKIAIIAGETSGDILGAGLIEALKHHYPDAEFEGIGGSLMLAQGCNSLFPLERLSVMGIVPILKRLPELLRMRNQLAERWIKHPPDLFIGIDAPEFTIGLELKLKAKGIKTVHYVSPSVWAWRPKRIHKIKKATDLMLCLFPFEQHIYQSQAIDNVCVGHPLADDIPLQSDKQAARAELNLDAEQTIVCIMPGSRGSEVKFLGQDFIEAASLFSHFYPNTKFIAPMANDKRRQQFAAQILAAKNAPEIDLYDGQSRQCMAASDLVLMASGTATLEAMLIKRPTVVAYKVGAISHWLFRKLLIIDTFAIPNLLSGKTLVPELMQENCNPDNLFAEMRLLMEMEPQQWKETEQCFLSWHKILQKNANVYAAHSIVQWWKNNVF